MPNTTTLQNIAAKSLLHNCVSIGPRQYLRAGPHQFASFWTRDFCFSIEGLMLVGAQQVVRDHLGALLDAVDEQGRVPRILAHRASAQIVLKWTLFRGVFRHQTEEPKEFGDMVLRPEILGEHKTYAIDSGLLVAYWALHLNERLGILNQPDREQSFNRILGYYRKHTNDFKQLLRQEAFADWQDSSDRRGERSFTQVLVLQLLIELLTHQLASGDELERWHDLLKEKFLKDGVLLDAPTLHPTRVSLEANLFYQRLLVSTFNHRELAQKNWNQLRQLGFTSALLGVPVSHIYDPKEISWTTKCVGLRHYHDKLRWSWLIADTLRSANLMGDKSEAANFEKILLKTVGEPQTVVEVFDFTWQPFLRLFYETEQPFSWGAARLLTALIEGEQNHG